VAGTILIVDDDPLAREGLRSVLESEGYGVIVTSDGSDALTYLNHHPLPSLIFLDMMMPRIDGWQFLTLFRQTDAWSHIPVIITTSMSVASPEWAESLGAAGLLKKPFDPQEMLEPLRQFC
jgi:CheY-like chemotaxis protein